MKIINLIILSSTMLAASVANAATWRLEPSINITETYTDNVFLDSNNEREDFITEITPGIHITADGRFLKMDFDYQYQNLIYADDSSLNDEYHQLRGTLESELIENHFYIEADANYGQSNVTNQGRTTDNNRNITGNRSNVSLFRITPIFKHSFAGLLDAELKYTYSSVGVETGAGDSDTNQFNIRLNNGRKFNRFSWALNYQNSDSDRTSTTTSSSDANTRFESTQANAILPLTRTWSLVADAGKEKNDFMTSRGNTDGDYVALGLGYRPNRRFHVEVVAGGRDRITLSWQPTQRTDLQFNVNNQNFGANIGDAVSASFRHHTRRSSWEFRYRDETTTTQRVLLDDREFVLTDINGDPVIDTVTGEPIIVNLDSLNLRDDVFNRKRLDATVTYNTPKSTFRVRLFGEDRVSEVDGSGSEKSVGSTFTWNWRLARRTESIVTANVRKNQFSDLQNDSDEFSLSMNLIRRISRSATATLTLQHFGRESENNSTNDYEENSLSAGIRATF